MVLNPKSNNHRISNIIVVNRITLEQLVGIKTLFLVNLKLFILVFVFVLGLLTANNSWAKPKSSFNLLITHSESDRLYDQQSIETRISTLTIYRAEQVSSRLAGRLIGGYQEQIQDKNTIPAAQYAAGYFLGLSLNYDVFQSTRYRFNVFSQYIYHQLEGRNGIQKVEVSWYDITFGFRNYLYIGSRFNLLADISYVSLTGSQRAFEPLSQTINFKNESTINYSLGMAYFISSSGYVGIKNLTGYQQGFQLIFAKDF